ncbi:unnamed protein product [Closterium sp. NIES-54]
MVRFHVARAIGRVAREQEMCLYGGKGDEKDGKGDGVLSKVGARVAGWKDAVVVRSQKIVSGRREMEERPGSERATVKEGKTKGDGMAAWGDGTVAGGTGAGATGAATSLFVMPAAIRSWSRALLSSASPPSSAFQQRNSDITVAALHALRTLADISDDVACISNDVSRAEPLLRKEIALEALPQLRRVLAASTAAPTHSAGASGSAPASATASSSNSGASTKRRDSDVPSARAAPPGGVRAGKSKEQRETEASDEPPRVNVAEALDAAAAAVKALAELASEDWEMQEQLVAGGGVELMRRLLIGQEYWEWVRGEEEVKWRDENGVLESQLDRGNPNSSSHQHSSKQSKGRKVDSAGGDNSTSESAGSECGKKGLLIGLTAAAPATASAPATAAAPAKSESRTGSQPILMPATRLTTSQSVAATSAAARGGATVVAPAGSATAPADAAGEEGLEAARLNLTKLQRNAARLLAQLSAHPDSWEAIAGDPLLIGWLEQCTTGGVREDAKERSGRGSERVSERKRKMEESRRGREQDDSHHMLLSARGVRSSEQSDSDVEESSRVLCDACVSNKMRSNARKVLSHAAPALHSRKSLQAPAPVAVSTGFTSASGWHDECDVSVPGWHEPGKQFTPSVNRMKSAKALENVPKLGFLFLTPQPCPSLSNLLSALRYALTTHPQTCQSRCRRIYPSGPGQPFHYRQVLYLPRCPSGPSSLSLPLVVSCFFPCMRGHQHSAAAQVGGSESGQEAGADISVLLLHKLVAAGVGERPVVFVTHSMGGLIVKQMLALSRASDLPEIRALAERTTAIVFYSVPHFGSRIADYSWRARAVLRPAPSADCLRMSSPHVEGLNTMLRHMHKQGKIQVLSFAETKVTPLVKTYGGLTLRLEVVPLESAYPGFGEFVVLDGTDHINACKPVNSSDPAYANTLNFLLKIRDATQKNADEENGRK